VELIDKEGEDPAERSKLHQVLEELASRGYRYRDIAVLTARNEEVVKVTTWLSERDIPFISYSSLDVRRRKVTGEIISLLRFLDSPPDDLAFAAFLLGEIFRSNLQQEKSRITPEQLHEFIFRNRRNPPLYKVFQKELGDLWERFFSRLFRSVGYLPLYDLVTEAFRVFRVFAVLQEDEATFARILEAVKDFEGSGSNSLRDFIGYADEEKTGGSEWEIDVPRNMNAVKVMTIHKAKGLGFPVVIVLLYGTSRRGFDYILDREGEETVFLKLNQRIIASAPQFKGRYDEEVVKEMVNRLNSLYVGFTRAREELYVIGIRGKKDSRPFDLLPVLEYPPVTRPERILERPADEEWISPLYHPAEPPPFHAITHEPGGINPEERRRGELIHRVFSLIEWREEDFEARLARAIRVASDEMRAEYDPRELKEIIRKAIEHPEVKELFIPRPGREIRREQEFVDGEGRLSRMDRLVIDQDQVIVVDWKTGKDRNAERAYEVQMRNYLKILEGIYPERRIEGFIVYVDRGEVERVK
jgi:ATP-dependent exoDNAse (exonuclease V) beta subunit